jgi:hypothetical protein
VVLWDVTLIGPTGGHRHSGVTYFFPQDGTCSSESATHLTTVHGATIQTRGLWFAPRVPNGVRRRRQLYQIDGIKDRVVCDFLAMTEQKHSNLYNLLVTTKQTARKQTGGTEVSLTHPFTHSHTLTHTHTHTPVCSIYNICAPTAYNSVQQALTGPEGSRRLRLLDFKKSAHEGGKVVSPMHRPPLPPGNIPGTYFC